MAMEAFYEESAVNANAEREQKRYKVVHVIAWVFLVLGFVSVYMGIAYVPVEILLPYSVICLQFFVTWFIFQLVKRRFNVSYDYVFVSGELRIGKVFNLTRRRLVAMINCEDILQIGDVDNGAYERLSQSPEIDVCVCTRNAQPMDDKFFMYILTGGASKTLYLLECREGLLINILKFARRGVLEKEYVAQEKKQKNV